MGLRFDDLGDFLQVEGHGLGVAPGQDQARALALLGADGAEDVGRAGALIMGCPRLADEVTQFVVAGVKLDEWQDKHEDNPAECETLAARLGR